MFVLSPSFTLRCVQSSYYAFIKHLVLHAKAALALLIPSDSHASQMQTCNRMFFVLKIDS